MWPDRVSNPVPLAHKSDALPTALRGPAIKISKPSQRMFKHKVQHFSSFTKFQQVVVVHHPDKYPDSFVSIKFFKEKYNEGNADKTLYLWCTKEDGLSVLYSFRVE